MGWVGFRGGGRGGHKNVEYKEEGWRSGMEGGASQGEYEFGPIDIAAVPFL